MQTGRVEPAQQRVVGADELAAEIERTAMPPAAQGGSAPTGAILGIIVSNTACNRYTVQLASPAATGYQPAAIPDEFVSAINVAEPFDEAGQLDAGTVVLVWPGQGDYGFSCPRPPDEAEPAQPAVSYWAKVVSGSGPSYTVRGQIATDDNSFQDATGFENVAAANVWELSVDPDAMAAVPAGAIVRVFEELDTAEQTRRFFFYPIHTVYR